MEVVGGRGSVSPSPCSSFNPSPNASYNPSPASSSFSSPCSSSFGANANAKGNSLIPWLKNFTSASSSTHFHIYGGGSISAPVTPPLSSPISRGWGGSEWFNGIRIPLSRPTLPTLTLVSASPFEFRDKVMMGCGSHMWTPGKSGTCSPANIAVGADHAVDVPMRDEFAFGSDASTFVKPWEGKRIYEECGSDDLELTLGSTKTR